jgi:hypothetical protein
MLTHRTRRVQSTGSSIAPSMDVSGYKDHNAVEIGIHIHRPARDLIVYLDTIPFRREKLGNVVSSPTIAGCPLD